MAGRRRGAAVGAWVGVVLLAGGFTTGRGGPAASQVVAQSQVVTKSQVIAQPQVVTHAPSRQVLAARYLVIAREGNRRLEIDFDRLAGPDRHRLAAARADLRDVAATEREFDRRLLAIDFPPAIERVAHRLVAVNQSRARLTSAAATSTSLRELHRYERRLTAANVPVEQAVSTIRSQLGLPPPATS